MSDQDGIDQAGYGEVKAPFDEFKESVSGVLGLKF